MATKTKQSKAKHSRKSSTKKSAAPATEVANHGFAPGTEVGFHPAHTVGVERGLGREPFAKPVKTVKVGKTGRLEVGGLTPGQWCAVGETPRGWRYFQFAVKE